MNWEYVALEFPSRRLTDPVTVEGDSTSSVIEALNLLGADGWELVSVNTLVDAQNAPLTMAVLKRSLDETLVKNR